MKLVIGILAVVLAAGEVCFASEKPVAIAPKAAVLHLAGRTPDGISINITAQPGWKVIYFWSSLCPCVRSCEKFSFLPLASQYKGKVSFYAIVATWSDLNMNMDAIRQKLGQHQLPFPALVDSHRQIADVLGATLTPQTFLLDTNNNIIFSGVPDDSWEYLRRTGHEGFTRAYLANAITEALAGKNVTQPVVKGLGCSIR